MSRGPGQPCRLLLTRTRTHLIVARPVVGQPRLAACGRVFVAKRYAEMEADDVNPVTCAQCDQWAHETACQNCLCVADWSCPGGCCWIIDAAPLLCCACANPEIRRAHRRRHARMAHKKA